MIRPPVGEEMGGAWGQAFQRREGGGSQKQCKNQELWRIERCVIPAWENSAIYLDYQGRTLFGGLCHRGSSRTLDGREKAARVRRTSLAQTAPASAAPPCQIGTLLVHTPPALQGAFLCFISTLQACHVSGPMPLSSSNWNECHPPGILFK